MGPALADDIGVIAARHEADFHAVRLGGNGGHPRFGGDGPDIRLHVPADGEEQVWQHVPLDAVQDVRLILFRIDALVQFAVDNLGIVPRGDGVAAELLTELPELAELQPVVADDAGVRRAALEVFVREIIDDRAELVFEIEGVKRNVELVRHAAGIAGVNRGAATLLIVPAGIRFFGMHARAHE